MLLDDYTYLLPGDKAPDLHIQTLEQGLIKTREAGILLVNLFIIPCLHCKRMFEFMEENIWPDLPDKKFSWLAIGRDHTIEEVKTFREEGNYSLPFAADPDGSIYSHFAEKKVPRNYLFDASGELVYHTRGYNLDQMATLKSILLDLLA